MTTDATTGRVDHIVERGSSRIGVTTWAGDGPPLVLTHGAGLCARIFEPVVAQLRREWEVVALDLAGHGRSDEPASRDGHGLPAQAADLMAVLDHRGDEAVSVFGHSFGGAVVMRALLDHPERFDAVAVFEPALGHPDDDPVTVRAGSKRFREVIQSRPRRWPDRAAVLDHLRAIPSYGELDDAFLDALVTTGTTVSPDGLRMTCSPETEATLFEVTLSDAGGYGLLPDLPALAEEAARFRLLCGDGSRFRLGLYERVAELADVPLTVVEGYHFAPFRSPAGFVGMVRDYVRDRSGVAPTPAAADAEDVADVGGTAGVLDTRQGEW